MNKILNSIFKFILMIPVFAFIGCGIFVSLDIIQPSMLNNIPKHYIIFSISIFVGYAPVILVVSAIRSLIDFYNKGHKICLGLSIVLMAIFMSSETLYSYVSLKTIYDNQTIPLLKILGILALPFTFSLFYLIKIILDELMCSNNVTNKINELSSALEIEQLALKIAPSYYETPTTHEKERNILVDKIIEKGMLLATKN